MTVERLRAVLSRVGPPDPDGSAITPQEIAEILWLAAQISEKPLPVHTEHTEPVDNDGEVSEWSPPDEDVGEQPRQLDPSLVPAPIDRPRELHPPHSESDEGTDASDVLVPTAPMLDHPLAVQRALRPLKRRVPARRAKVLNEDATAARIADRPLHERPWVPVLAAAPERWLSLVLVIDDGPSMRLWRPLARELHETFVRLGAFRNLRVCHLSVTGKGVGVSASRGAPPRDVATLIDPSGRQVVLVLSDCSGSHWWDGSAGRALHLWSHAGPVAILQPLTERLWRRTAAPTIPGNALAPRPCAPNIELRFNSYDRFGDTRPSSVPVPVLECSPEWLADWATLVVGGSARPTAMTYVSDRPRRETGPVRQERELSIRERVQRFSSTASPEAAQLAAHVAVSFPALPVMRLIQQRVLRSSRPGHLAEVLLSGLLRPIGAEGGRYDFVPGAREALLTELPRSESWHTADVLFRVSEEIERLAGTAAETFRAYLPADDGTGGHSIGPEGRPFALVSGEAIRLLNHAPLSVSASPWTTIERVATDFPSDAKAEVAVPDELSLTLEAARFLRLIDVPDLATLDLEELRRQRERRFLQVPFAEDTKGFPVFLDLKEAAHGLCVGATGSGKSELLRTFVLALATTHTPDQVSMVLVDYKGGVTFAPFEGLPHVAGMITNLAEDTGLVERAAAGLAGELRRRQRLLRDAGDVSIHDYRTMRERNPRMEPLPHLLVVVDEFAELLSARSELTDLFMLIGQIGHSIGVHLLLASQRIDDRELRELVPHFSYRLGLHMFTERQSRMLLDNTDAYRLPRTPGAGYLKAQTSSYRRFHTAYVSGPAFTNDDLASAPGRERTLLRMLTARLAIHGGPSRRIWLPQMADVTTLDEVCGQPVVTEWGLRLPTPDAEADPSGLCVPLGVIDDRAVWNLDLDVDGGHVAVVGSPRSGKTTLLHTLVIALALTRSPRQLAMYAVDLAGTAGMRPLGVLPHLGAVAGRGDMERIRRIIEDVRAMLDHREQVFQAKEIQSIARLRSMHEAGLLQELPAADIVLVIDGIETVHGPFQEFEDDLVHLMRRGSSYGIHVVASMLRRNKLSSELRSGFGTTVELWRNDPADSTDPRHADAVRGDQPGRALVDGGLFAQVALPRIDGVTSAADLAQVVERTGRAVRDTWPSDPVPPIRMLPRRLPADDLPDTAREPRRVPIGVDESGLAHVSLALFDRDQHLLALGDDRCGKTNLLKLIARGLIERHPAERLAFVIMDPRGRLRHTIPDAYLDGYAEDPEACARLAADVADRLAGRATAWHGSGLVGRSGRLRTVVLADDYELLTRAGRQPFTPFVPHIPNGDLGLHFVVTRRVTGASSSLSTARSHGVTGAGRALYEPFLMAMRQAGSTGLVMSGEHHEGPLLSGMSASPQPPGRGWWVRPGKSTRLIQTALVRDDSRNLQTLLAIELHRSPLWDSVQESQPEHTLGDILDRCEFAIYGRTSWTRRSAGDRVIVTLPADTDASAFLDEFPRELTRVLVTLNTGRPAGLHTRLRVALHCGPADSSSMSHPGVLLGSVNELVNADPLRDLLNEHPDQDMALIVSDMLYREVAQEDPRALDRNHLVPTAFYVNGMLNGGFLYEESPPDVSPPGISGPPEDA
jgi:type VII secretion protein EccCb